MVITTGIGAPFSSFWVWALNDLQNSMMLRPRWPSAGPIGGEGFAAPAGTCNFRYPVTFFAICHSSCCFQRIPEASQDRGAVQRMIGDHPSPPTVLRKRRRFHYSSLPGATQQSISFARCILRRSMDARVKPGQDDNDKTFST